MSLPSKQYYVCATCSDPQRQPPRFILQKTRRDRLFSAIQLPPTTAQALKMASSDKVLPKTLQLLSATRLENGIDLIAAGGSILDYEGDCMVNAANAGGITGFGLDELVNRKAGNDMKEARRKLNGIPTGSAKSTPSFNHTSVKWVIHATGPVFRENALSKETLEETYQLLQSAYQNALLEATNLGCKDIGFCLLSCGVFRGEESLKNLIKLALKAVISHFAKDDMECSVQKVVFVAYTQEEQETLKGQVDDLNHRESTQS